jgi:hypothetical protein
MVCPITVTKSEYAEAIVGKNAISNSADPKSTPAGVD